MTPERWREIEQLYQLALEHEAGQRAAFLVDACRGDEEMRREIESLLTHAEPAEGFMEAPGMAVLAQAIAQERSGSMVGRQIGAYRILAFIGAGGMGEVYRARDTRLGRLVALKILPGGVATDPERRRRLLHEARAASVLNHPHIVTLHDVGNDNGIDFLVMEYLAGNTLDKVIPRNGLGVRTALRYAIEIADALAKAHAAGIIHRDLKPGNIMVTEDEEVKVLDFGIAKLTEIFAAGEFNTTRPAPTTTGEMILGTASYMSPEQTEGKKLDPRSDIFSFGAVLYEMVTGRTAFQGSSKVSTLSAILHEAPLPADQVVKNLPREMDRIIARCLRKDPERRFQNMADVKVALEKLERDMDSPQRDRAPASKRGQRRRIIWAAVLAVIIGVGAGVLWFYRSSAKPSEAAQIPVPLTTYPGFQGEPSFSPDGNQVAFTWDGGKLDNRDIYIKLVGAGGPPLRLTQNPARDYSPAWSPDGRFIAFLRALPTGKAAMLLVPALGGPERKVSEISPWDDDCTNLAWSPDANFLATSGNEAPGEPPLLYLISVEGGEKRRLTSPRAALFGDACPAFSPDGRILAFSRVADGGGSDIYLLDLADGIEPRSEPKRLSFTNRGVGAPAWTPDGHEIIFSIGWPAFLGDHELWRIAASVAGAEPAKPERLAHFSERAFQPTVSRRGQRLAYVHVISHSDIWRVATPIASGNAGLRSAARRALDAAPTPFISSTRDDIAPQYSPDGQKISFVSLRSGTYEIWVCDGDGSNPAQLTALKMPDPPTHHWSPDGRRIVFDSDLKGQWDIWVVDINGGKPQRLTTDPANHGNPSWSRDGRWIYFDWRRTGKQQIWKVPASGGAAIQVTRNGGFAPIESPDGKLLYYTDTILGACAVWKAPVDGGRATKVLDGISDYSNLAVAEAGLYFVSVNDRGSRSSIQFLDFATNNVKTIASLEKALTHGLALSPDGRWLLYSQVDQEGSELMLVENFR